MKKLILICALCTPLWVQAQRIDDVLRSIEQNNLELQSQQQILEAQKVENKSQNNLSDPTVSYGRTYSNLNTIDNDFSVSQQFDFPTQYFARSKHSNLQNNALNLQQQAIRRDILLRAQLLCLDLIRLNQENQLMEIRMKNANTLAELYSQRLSTGDASIIEMNKIEMERITVKTEVARINSEHRLALHTLLAMNGNQPLEFEQMTYPEVRPIVSYEVMRDRVVAADYELQAALTSTKAAEKNVAVIKQNWLPKLHVSYSYSKDDVQKKNGFMVGAAIPIFANNRKVKVAKAQALGSRLAHQNAQLELENTLMAQFNEMRQYKEALDACNEELLYNALEILNKALNEGQISLIDYFVESDQVYKNLQSRMMLENQYQRVMATINKNDL